MEITIRIRGDVARSLQRLKSPSVESQELLRTVADIGVSVEPLHPGIDDPRLVRYFRITVPDPVVAEQVIARLWQLPAVEAAYIRPPDATP
jgi:hypothetical protein